MPGRRWLRLATGLAAILLLVVVVLVAVNLQSGGEASDPGEDDPSTSAPPREGREPAAARPLNGVAASALDPQGDGGENDESAPLAVDGRRTPRGPPRATSTSSGPAASRPASASPSTSARSAR